MTPDEEYHENKKLYEDRRWGLRKCSIGVSADSEMGLDDVHPWR